MVLAMNNQKNNNKLINTNTNININTSTNINTFPLLEFVSNKKITKKIIAAIILFSYAYGEFVEYRFWNKLDTYGVYYFELMIVIIGSILYFKDFNWKMPWKLEVKGVSSYFKTLLVTFLCGFFVHRISVVFDLKISFDMTAASTVVLLLVIAPILEELLFRQTLWALWWQIIPSKWIICVITAAMFAYGHFYSVFIVPSEYHPFLYVQTTYAFIFGIWFAHRYSKHKNIFTSMGMHFSFNLAFYISFLLVGII